MTPEGGDSDSLHPMSLASRLRKRLRPATAGGTDLGRSWGQVLCYALVMRLVIGVLAIPGLALLLRLSLAGGERAALSDQEILFFFLKPVGFVALVLVGGFWIGVALLEQSGMMLIGYGATEGRRVTWWVALRGVIRKLPVILLLGIHALLRILVLVLPFGAVAGGVYWMLLRHHDINYYLARHPPEFIWAAVLVGAVLLVLGILLVRKVMGWMYALPIVLFEDLRPPEALRKSVMLTRGRRLGLLAWTAAWFVGGLLLSGLVTWLTGAVGRHVLPLVSNSIPLAAFTMGSIGLLTLLLHFLITLLAAALFAVVVVRLYRRDSGASASGSLAVEFADAEPIERYPAWSIPDKRLLVGGVAVAALALFGAILIVSHLKLEDHAVVLAHRGASVAAPENSMAAVQQAIEARADYVEIDVQETVDGDVVVFHDSDFMKTAGNPLKIWDATKADLAEIDIGSWFGTEFRGERVPTLAEVLERCNGKIRVDIELKYYGHDQQLEQRVVDLVEQHDMAKEVLIMSLKYDKLAKVRALRPDWTCGLLSSITLGDLSEFDVDFLAVNVAKAKRSFIRRAHSDGKKVYVWTVNDPFAMSTMLSRGVDGLITDNPVLALRVLEMRRGLNPLERLLLGIGSGVGTFGKPQSEIGDEDA